MDLKHEVTTHKTSETTEVSTKSIRKPLELLRDTEALLRCKTVETLVTVLPPPVAISLEEASAVAEDSLNQLAEIEIDEISDFELQPARIFVGLSFVGFGALAIVFLILYLYTLHPELGSVEQIREYWYQYTWFVSLGVTGMLVLGREAMRSQNRDRLDADNSSLE